MDAGCGGTVIAVVCTAQDAHSIARRGIRERRRTCPVSRHVPFMHALRESVQHAVLFACLRRRQTAGVPVPRRRSLRHLGAVMSLALVTACAARVDASKIRDIGDATTRGLDTTRDRARRDSLREIERLRVRRLTVDSVLAVMRARPARPRGESLRAVDDSVNAAQARPDAAMLAQYVHHDFRGSPVGSFDELVELVAGYRIGARMVHCGVWDGEVAGDRAQVLRRDAYRDTTGTVSTYRRSYLRVDGRWYLTGSGRSVEPATVRCRPDPSR